MQLTDLLTPGRIKLDMSASTKDEAIAELIDLLASNNDLDDPPEALRAVQEREAIRTTGIGRSLAVPHGKCLGLQRMILAVGVAPSGVDFQSLDGQDVTLAVLLLSPADRTGPHIQALARISRLLSSDAICRRLRQAQTPQQAYDLIAREETETAGAARTV